MYLKLAHVQTRILTKQVAGICGGAVNASGALRVSSWPVAGWRSSAYRYCCAVKPMIEMITAIRWTSLKPTKSAEWRAAARHTAFCGGSGVISVMTPCAIEKLAHSCPPGTHHWHARHSPAAMRRAGCDRQPDRQKKLSLDCTRRRRQTGLMNVRKRALVNQTRLRCLAQVPPMLPRCQNAEQREAARRGFHGPLWGVCQGTQFARVTITRSW